MKNSFSGKQMKKQTSPRLKKLIHLFSAISKEETIESISTCSALQLPLKQCTKSLDLRDSKTEELQELQETTEEEEVKHLMSQLLRISN